MPSRTLEYLKKILFVLLYAVLLSPLLVSSDFFFPYISTKIFFFRLLVEAAVCVYILVAAADSRFRPRLTPLIRAVIIFGTILFLTSLAGLNFYRSFWGNTERGEGLLTVLLVLAFFVMLAGSFSSLRAWEKYFTFSVLVSLASAVYALAQKLGLGFVIPGDVSRVSATIGNASFFAGYLLPHIYLAAWLAFRSRGILLKTFFWLAVAFELYILNETGTRGAFLGLLAGLVIFLVFSAVTAKNRKWRLVAAGWFVGLLLVAGLVWGIKETSIISSSGGLYRITHMSLGDITTQSRLLTWNASYLGFRDRWISGWGYENFNLAFNKYFPAEIFRDNGSQIWFDRAHNVVVDIAVESGVLGLLSYLSLYAAAFWFLWRYYQKDPPEHRLTSIIFFALLVGYFIQNLFVFDTLGTYISFYAILAFVSYLSVEKTGVRVVKPARELPVNYSLAGGLAAVLIFVSFFTVFEPAAANRLVMKGLYSAAVGDLNKTEDNYKQVFDADTYVTEEARQKFAEALLGFNYNSQISQEAKLKAYRRAIEELQQQIRTSPHDARNYLYLMTLYNSLPSNEVGPKEEAIRLGRQALALSPTRPQIYFEMGQAAFALGKSGEGMDYFKKGLDLNRFPAESHWNLALAYALNDQVDDLNHELDYVFNLERVNLINENSLRLMVKILESKDRYAVAARIYKELVRRKPNDASRVLDLASAYGKKCDVEQANNALNLLVATSEEQTKALRSFRDELASRCGK